MIVVVEGPDGSGKTTLARDLAERAPGGTYTKHWGPVYDPMRVYTQKLKRPEAEHAIFDRFWPSEYVYGHALRGRSRLTRTDRLALCARARRAYGRLHVVVCLPPLDRVRANLAARGEADDMEGVSEQIDALWRGYANYPHLSQSVTTYDYTVDQAPTWEHLLSA